MLSATFLLLASGGTAACDSDSPNEDGHFYCTDNSGTVVDEDYCDDSNGGGGGFFFMYMGSSMHAPPAGHSSYPVGSKLPASAPKFSVSDKAARQKFGLPATGKVTNGTVKTGVVGKGGAGSSVKSGSGKIGGGAKGGSGGG
jgi:hypothetical protein